MRWYGRTTDEICEEVDCNFCGVCKCKETLSWGSKPAAKKYQEEQAQLIREGKIDEAFQREYEDIKSTFNGKYDQVLDEMIDDALARGFLSKDFRAGNTRIADNLAMDSNTTTLAV